MPLDDLEEGLLALKDAEPDYRLAELYYDGRNPEHFASLRMRRALRAYEAKYRLRLAKVPVDAVANRLEIATVTVNRLDPGAEDQGEEPVTDQDQELTQILQDDVRDAQDMDVEESEVMFRACEFGDAYVIVDHDPDMNTVSVFYNNPFECRVIYDRSGRFKRFAIKVWYDTDDNGRDFGRATLFYADAIEEYITKPGSDGRDIANWVLTGPGSPMLDQDGNEVLDDRGNPIIEDGIFWFNFGQIPVFHFRTRRPYGLPEHEAAYGPQDMIDKLTISHMATADFQAFPQRYFLEDPNFEGTDEGEDWSGDDADATTVSEPEKKLKAGPGEAWFLTGIKSAGEFQPADPDAFLKPIDRFAKAMSLVTDTPIHLFDAESSSSGEEKRAKEAGQTKKVRRRQRQFGATWREVYAYALACLTGEDFFDLRERVEVRWVPAESIDPAEALDLALKKKTLGLPLQQILAEHGYSADDIKAFMKQALEERKELIELQRESFQSSMQERRDDRPDRPNPDVPAEQGGAE